MSNLHHETAIISDSATISDDVKIDAHVIIEDGVVIGAGTVIKAYAQILSGTVIGNDCVIGRNSIIGEEPQDLINEPSEGSGVVIGDGCTIRELVTIHKSTGNSQTKIGKRNFLMAGCHVAHDVVMGDDNIIANNALLAGHVWMGDNVTVGGGAVFHQFVRIGSRSMIQGNAACSMDIPPCAVATQLNSIVGLNSVGLKRAGYSTDEILELRNLYKVLCKDRTGSMADALHQCKEDLQHKLGAEFIDFFEGASKKGIARHRRR